MNVASLFASLGLKVDLSAFKKAEKMIDKLHAGLEALMVYEGVRFFTDAVKGTLELGQRIKELAQSTGVGTEAIQTMGYAAELNGVTTEGMANALGKLSRSMYQAAHGSKQASASFAQMGVKVTDANGKLRPTEDVLQDISDHFASMPDGAEKTALAMSVLGRAGKELIPLLNRGGKSLREMAEEAKELGVVLDDDAVDKLEEANKSVKRIQLGLEGFKNQAVIALLPYLQQMSEKFLAWIKANKAEIIDKLTKAVVFLGKALSLTVTVVKAVATYFYAAYTAAESLYDGLAKAAEESDVLRDVLVGAAIAIGAAFAIAEAPMLVIAGLIAAVILVGQDLYVWANGGESLFGKLWDKIAAGHPVIKEIGEALAWLGGIIKDTIHGLGALSRVSDERTLKRDINDRTAQAEAKGKELAQLRSERGEDSVYDTDLDKKSHAFYDKKIAEKQAELDKITRELHADKRAYNKIQDEYNEGEGKYDVRSAEQDKAAAAAPYVTQALAPMRAAQAVVATQQLAANIMVTVHAGEANAKEVTELISQHLAGALRQAQAQVGKR